MSYTIRKTFRFEAAHFLPQHDGKCRHLHGHSWVVGVEVEADGLVESGPKAGMVMDYGDLKAIVRPVVDPLDHSLLNDVLENPTSEVLAGFLFEQLAPRFESPRLRLSSVTVQETCTSEATYRRRR